MITLEDRDYIDFNYDGLDDNDVYVTKEQELLANDLFDLLQDLIGDPYNTTVNEEFVSVNALNRHFNDHCLANNVNRRSTTHNIYYDFNNVDKYRQYENKILNEIKTTNLTVASLEEIDLVLKYFRKLFEGNKSIQFYRSCGFKNDRGEVILGLHSFATSVTTNYSRNNTIDIMVISRNYKTISMYAVDAHYLESKFNNIINRYAGLDIEFKINDK